jgi:hypothetical protein
VTGDLDERAKFLRGHRLEEHVVALLFDQDLGAVETDGLRKADGLTASVAKDRGGDHSYEATYLRERSSALNLGRDDPQEPLA